MKTINEFVKGEIYYNNIIIQKCLKKRQYYYLIMYFYNKIKSQNNLDYIINLFKFTIYLKIINDKNRQNNI